jgi:hypothetical protein
MHHNTYDRLSGSWWGSIIGQTIVDQSVNSFNPFTQPWLLERRKIAEMLLAQELNTTNSTDLFSASAFQSAANMTELTDQVDDLKYNGNLLSLLPVIIFQTDEQDLRRKLRGKNNLKSANSPSNISLSQDVLIWSCLLNIALNSRSSGLAQKTVSTVMEEIFNHHQVPKSPLTDQLRLVFSAIQRGSSLTQVVEQLSSKDQSSATAIALAWYCFATTPHDFKLSVTRAARIESNQGWLITTLTATLSGAYNGMALISQSRRVNPEQDPEAQSNWHLENQLLTKLFRSWLGIYSTEGDGESYNLKLDAIALPKVIQPRQKLKIISQSSF